MADRVEDPLRGNREERNYRSDIQWESLSPSSSERYGLGPYQFDVSEPVLQRAIVVVSIYRDIWKGSMDRLAQRAW
jgi:hypothetical protein